jgi:hypothetical protein
VPSDRASILFSDDAESYLIERGARLSKKQRLVIRQLTSDLEADPSIGERVPDPTGALAISGLSVSWVPAFT